MGKTTRPYNREQARRTRLENKERKRKGLPPVNNRPRKTGGSRPYVYSGKWKGKNGGKIRQFKKKVLAGGRKPTEINNSQSKYMVDGKSKIKKKKGYQGQYHSWHQNKKEKSRSI